MLNLTTLYFQLIQNFNIWPNSSQYKLFKESAFTFNVYLFEPRFGITLSKFLRRRFEKVVIVQQKQMVSCYVTMCRF